MTLNVIPSVLINKDGDLIIPDGISKKIYRFNEKGYYIQTIGNWGGHGPGEFEIPGPFALNKSSDFYVFDRTNYRLSKYEYPDYKYANAEILPISPNDIIITDDNSLITYNFKEFILQKLKSNIITKKEKFNLDKNIMQINSRFNLGGIANDANQGFFFIYPEKYEIRYLNYNLVTQYVLKSKEISKFRIVSLYLCKKAFLI